MAAQAINDWTEGWMDGLMDSCMAEWLSGCVMLKPAAHGKSQQGYLPGYAAPKMSSAINPDKARYCQSYRGGKIYLASERKKKEFNSSFKNVISLNIMPVFLK